MEKRIADTGQKDDEDDEPKVEGLSKEYTEDEEDTEMKNQETEVPDLHDIQAGTVPGVIGVFFLSMVLSTLLLIFAITIYYSFALLEGYIILMLIILLLTSYLLFARNDRTSLVLYSYVYSQVAFIGSLAFIFTANLAAPLGGAFVSLMAITYSLKKQDLI